MTTASRTPSPTEKALPDVWTQCPLSSDGNDCAVLSLLDLVGSKWTVRIIHTLQKESVVRFLRLQRLVAPITQKELTKRLRELEHAGLVQRTVYAEVPPRVEYRLTPRGETLVPPLAALAQWADKNAG